MIEIVNAYTRSVNEWCTCCQKQTNTKRIKFSYDGRQGNSVVLCDDCRRELAQVIGAIPIPEGATNGDVIKAMFPNIEIEGIGGFEGLQCVAVGIGLGTSFLH